MVMAAIKQLEIDRQIKLDESGVVAVLHKEIKSRRESLEEAERANRRDLVEAARAEIEVLEVFLPKGLSANELEAMSASAIAEVNAESPADMGRVMKVLMPRIQGRAPGDQVSLVVRKLLGS